MNTESQTKLTKTQKKKQRRSIENAMRDACAATSDGATQDILDQCTATIMSWPQELRNLFEDHVASISTDVLAKGHDAAIGSVLGQMRRAVKRLGRERRREEELNSCADMKQATEQQRILQQEVQAIDKLYNNLYSTKQVITARVMKEHEASLDQAIREATAEVDKQLNELLLQRTTACADAEKPVKYVRDGFEQRCAAIDAEVKEATAMIEKEFAALSSQLENAPQES